jgi:hypothetical protein
MKLIMAFVLLINFCSILPADNASSQYDIYTIPVLKKATQFNYQSNNRVDRQNYARVNRPIYQPKKQNHEPRCSNRGNR